MGIAKLIKKRVVVSEYRNGINIRDLAKKYDLSTTTIRNYINEDEEEHKARKDNALRAKEKEAEIRAKEREEAKERKEAKKAERNAERRNTLEVRAEIAEGRRQRVKADIKAGISKEEIVEREGISRATINDYLRGDAIPEGAETYKETICPAVRMRVIREWADEQIARQINTPAGKMTVCAVYPNFMRLTTGSDYQNFTLGELYYMNVG